MAALLDFLQDFSLVFIPLFVVMDPLAILPFLVPFLGSIPQARRSKVIHTAAFTGLVIGLVFLGLGRGIFIVLGITEQDFLIAGGLILLVVSLRELISSGIEGPVAPNELVAVVPIGTPLLVGPASISMLIVLTGMFSLWLVILGFLSNILVAWLVFLQSERIARFLGQGGLQAFAKVSYLLLAAIAVQLIREGVSDVIRAM